VKSPPPSECAVCGALIPRQAQACPECGADERTGWREPDPYDGLDLPDEAWADDDASKSHPSGRSTGPGGLAWGWWLAGLLVLLAFGLGVLGLR
jgi:hypothetical protein